MKVAFHFDSRHPSATDFYGGVYDSVLFHSILLDENPDLSSRVFVGDLLIAQFAMKSEGVEAVEFGGKSGTAERFAFQRDRFLELTEQWLDESAEGWHMLSPRLVDAVIHDAVYVICVESISAHVAVRLHERLAQHPGYLGVLEISDESRLHWGLYSMSLIPLLRIVGRKAYLFREPWDEDQGEEDKAKTLRMLGFEQVEFEALNGKYTIFDEYANFFHARRVAQWKRGAGSLLAFVADEVVTRLGDSAPELGPKLLAAFNALDRAEGVEEYAQVTTTCRRVIEYVTDAIFPPSAETRDGRKLGGPQFRNRLLAFADDQHKSETNIDLVVVSTEALREQVEKLSALANKGVHSEVMRSEARRCLLRTVTLLDDIISLKPSPFPVRDHVSVEKMADWMQDVVERDTEKS
jgi:hypothetical protein